MQRYDTIETTTKFSRQKYFSDALTNPLIISELKMLFLLIFQRADFQALTNRDKHPLAKTV